MRFYGDMNIFHLKTPLMKVAILLLSMRVKISRINFQMSKDNSKQKNKTKKSNKNLKIIK